MKKLKYILVLFVLITTTVVINGGTKAKPCLEQVKPASLVRKVVVEGFPDMLSFSNFNNQ